MKHQFAINQLALIAHSLKLRRNAHNDAEAAELQASIDALDRDAAEIERMLESRAEAEGLATPPDKAFKHPMNTGTLAFEALLWCGDAMDLVCENCGQRLGHHDGEVCPS